MAEWTPEATEYLEGYLKQVRALARQASEDGEEIASGLRDHITEKTEREGGPLVTLELLRRTLAEVGSPEAIVEGGTTWDTRTNGTQISDVDTPILRETTPAINEVRKSSRGTGRSLFLGCAILGSVAIIAAIGLFALVFWVRYTNFQKVWIIAAEDRAVSTLRNVAAAERRWLAEKKQDNDSDGISDYATLAELVTAKYVPEDLGHGAKGPYIINIMIKNSSENSEKKPTFQCSARRLEGLDTPLRPLVITDEEVVRYGAPWGPVFPIERQDQVESESIKKASGHKKEAIVALQVIARAEREVLKTGRFDSDNDGTSDYTDLYDLDRETGDASTFGRHEVEGYAFHIELTTSSQPGGPHFVAKAIPTDASSSKEIIAIEPDGSLRFINADKLAPGQTEQIEKSDNVETEIDKPAAQ